jgi:hypothetical protein
MTRFGVCSPHNVAAALAVIVLGVALTGCTHVIDGPPPTSERPVAPITAGQVVDLLSSHAQNKDGNLFSKVDPKECEGISREVDPPLIFGHDPAATDGGHWVTDGSPEVYIEEMVGVFHADFDAKRALADAQQAIDACRGHSFTVVTVEGDGYAFELAPPVKSPSPDIVLWSFKGSNWGCDSAFTAAHNAAVGISTCGAMGGSDVASLARDALERINKLANTTA